MTLHSVSRTGSLILAVLALAVFLPAGFDKIFVHDVDDPLIFYSPVLKQFIYQESLGEHRFSYRDESGNGYSRQEFEANLPFHYHRNLELQNALPIEIEGRLFDAQAIQQNRQGLEIKARHLRGHSTRMELYPLFDNDPHVAMMPFPEDVFRATGPAMEFINADHNRIDRDLTEAFTAVLDDLGFAFPATVVGGRPTNLKPFDDGYFIRDSTGHVFHIRRVQGRPEIIRTGIPPSLDILDLVISENRRREFHGLAITRQGGVFLISTDGYRLIQLPLAGYDPTTMDLKLLIDPLYRTASISDGKYVRAVAMDEEYQPLRSHVLPKVDPTPPFVRIARDLVFPYQVRLDSQVRDQADVRLLFGGPLSLAGILVAVAAFVFLAKITRRFSLTRRDATLVLLTGVYGLIALAFIGND